MKRLLVLACLVTGCDEPAAPAVKPFVHLEGIPDELFLRTVDETISFEMRAVKPDGSPAEETEYFLSMDGKAGFSPDKPRNQTASYPPIGDLTVTLEHQSPNVERVTVRGKSRGVPFQPPCFLSRLALGGADRDILVEQGTIPCRQPWVQFWGGPAKKLEGTESQVSLAVGEARPIFVLPLTSVDRGLSHHPLSYASQDEQIASVSPRGLVIAKLAGRTIVTASVDGLTRRIEVVVGDAGIPGLPSPEHSKNVVRAGSDLDVHFLMGDAFTGLGKGPVSTFLPNGAPEFTAGVGNQAMRGPVVARWTGTAFGLEPVAPASLEFSGLPAAVSGVRDERGLFYVAPGRAGFDLLVRVEAPDGGTFKDVALLEEAPSEIPLPRRADFMRGAPRFETTGAVTLSPRRGGGVWALWPHVAAFNLKRHPSTTLLSGGNASAFARSGYCVLQLRLAEVLPDDTVRIETVRESRRFVRELVTDSLGNHPCQVPLGAMTAFASPRLAVLGQAPGEAKPELLVVPASIAHPDDVLMPLELTGAHLVWRNGRWQNGPDVGSYAIEQNQTAELKTMVADSRRIPPSELPEFPPEIFNHFPNRWSTTLAPPNGAFTFGPGQTGPGGPGPFDRPLVTNAWAFWRFPQAHRALKLWSLERFEIVDLPREPPRPEAMLTEGKRIVSPAHPLQTPFVSRRPHESMVIADDGVVYGLRNDRWVPIAGSVAADGGVAQPAQVSALEGEPQRLGMGFLLVGGRANGTAVEPIAVTSSDGVAWVDRAGQRPTALASTVFATSDGGAVVMTNAGTSVTPTPSVSFSADVAQGPFSPLPALPAEATMKNVRVSTEPRLANVVVTDTGDYAVVANCKGTFQAPTSSLDFPGLWVRQVSASGQVSADVFAAFPTSQPTANLSQRDFFDASTAIVSNGVLYGLYLRENPGGTVENWSAFPLSFSLSTRQWQLGSALTLSFPYLTSVDAQGQPIQLVDPGLTNRWPTFVHRVALARSGSTFRAVGVIAEGPRERLFISTSADGISFSPKTFLRPNGGARQRVAAWGADSSGRLFLAASDDQSLPGSVAPPDTFTLLLP